MILKRLADEVQTQVSHELLATADGTEPLTDYELDFSRPVPLEPLDEALNAFAGRDLRPADDAAMAVAVRAALPLSAREAADRNLWWWLTLRRYPKIVRRRWAKSGDDNSLSRERMLGQVNRNALARLWWGAEMVGSLPDPDAYTRLMFKNQDLFEAIIGRSLGRYPEALGVILDELSPLHGKPAREIVRDLRFLLSTLVLEAITTDDLRGELQQFKAVAP